MRLSLALAFVMGISLSTLASEREGTDFFEQKIRPVLVKHCYECHSAESESLKGGLLVDSASGLLQGGDSGSAVVRGNPKESLLLEALRFESFEMPPAGKLPDDVIADFEKWVSMGAPDPRPDPVKSKPAATGIDLEAGRNFWSFQPPEEHVVPTVVNGSWPYNWIDNFILSRLEEKSLRPLPEADRATLLRRITYDLTGLPPRPAEIKNVIDNRDPLALNQYIEQLLETSQFGEHWGRHWLDVARYADSNGGDFNATFHNAWRYRNYVIATFNEDRPFSQFVIEQIAGDLLDAENVAVRERNLVATGFLMFGTKMLSERDKEKLRMDVVDEQVSAIGQAFMGMTLGCARCHDHKFDPIPTTDYYALAGILRGTQTLDGEIQKYVSNWTRQPLPLSSEHAQALQNYQVVSSRLQKGIKASEGKLQSLESKSNKSNILQLGIVLDDAQAELIGKWTASTYSKNFIGLGYVHDDRAERGQKKMIFKTDLPETGDYEVRLAFPGTGGRATNVPVLIHHADGETTVLVDQSKQAPILTMLKPLGRFKFAKDRPAIIEISNTDADGYVVVDAVQIIPVNELQEIAPDESQAHLADVTTLRKLIEDQKAELKQVEATAPEPAPLALAVREEPQPGDYFVCIRGEHRNLGQKVSRGFLSVANFEGTPQIEEGQSGRLALAKWVADPHHPLTARVYVNRVWKHLMGAGLVRSVDNFGTLGERPTHALLLDQLAVKFIEHDWSTKWLVREIMRSHTYRLTSEYEAEHWQADPENRLLWRANRKPLSAESIRDSMLLAAGKLEFTQGGPPVANLGTLVTQNRPDDTGVELKSQDIRTVYQPVIRNELPSIMRVFDFADPDFVTGERTQTTVPTQALWMLNAPMIEEHSKRVAERILEQQLSTDSEKLEQLCLLILGRPPREEETTVAFDFLKANETPELETWMDLAHSLFASAGFRMLD